MIRDEHVTLLAASTLNLSLCLVFIAEATTLLLKIKSALSTCILSLIVEGDNLLVINAELGT